MPRVAKLQPAAADLRQRPVGVGVLRARVAVAELRGQVEAQALGEPRGLGDRLWMLGEARRHLRRRGEHRARVAAPLGLGLLQRRVQAHGDERVLELGPPAVVGVDVAGRHAGDPEPLGERRQPPVAGPVATPQRSLQLDPEALGARRRPPAGAPAPPPGAARRAPSFRRARRSRRSRRGRRAPRCARAASRASSDGGEEDQPSRAAVEALSGARLRVRLGQQPAEVVPPGRRSRPAA